jgi:uncharacterized membrane-anchored protein YjiN (DUF445 family)
LKPQNQKFHQQILQKLALHLAAQPSGDHEPRAESPRREKDTVEQARARSSIAVVAARRQESQLEQLSSFLGEDSLPEQGTDSRIVGKGSSGKPTQNKSHVRAENKGFSQTRHRTPLNGSRPQEFHPEILQKLALHLAALPEPLQEPPQAATELSDKASWQHFGAPEEVGEDRAHCDRLIADLEACSDAAEAVKAQRIMTWVISVARPLSLTQSGTRVVQKATEFASHEQRDQLVEALLQGNTKELYTSPHANHVLAKVIAVQPPARLVCIAESISGKAHSVARNQFGSRILERLIEYCPEDLIAFLLDELLEDLEALARHQFGNFVVHSLFEHGAEARVHACVLKLLPHVLQHATHKTACNVVQRMLVHADLSSQAAIADAFLAGEGETSLESIAATRYGSFVVHLLVDRIHPRIDAVKARVKAAHPELQKSSFSQKKIVEFLGKSFFHK